jgi:enoyl-CoA hydratase
MNKAYRYPVLGEGVSMLEKNLVKEDELLKAENVNSVAILTINRHRKLNALNSELMIQLGDEIKKLEKDDSVRGIILTGVDKSFIVGADIIEMQNCNSETGIKFITGLHELINTIRQLKIPVIAAVNGYCYGAGLELAISCDLCIVSNRATFGMQEVKIGIPSVIEAALFPFMVGLAKTREMLLTGEIIDSATALQMGLVNHVVPHENLLKSTMDYTLKITENAPHAVTLQKQLINRWLENSGLDQSIKNGIDSFGLAFSYPKTSEILTNALKGDN